MMRMHEPSRTSDEPSVPVWADLEMPPDEDEHKDPLAVEFGRRGGLKGGRARADKLSASERADIASRAAKARWGARGNVEQVPLPKPKEDPAAVTAAVTESLRR